MADLDQLREDLRAEQAELRSVLESLAAADWDRPTPSPGWTVRHQVRHLAHGEELGRLAAVDPAAFAGELAHLLEDLDAIDAAVSSPKPEDTSELLIRWWTAAEGLRQAVAARPAGEPIGWITGPMSPASFLTARVMETFAHGHDIRDALGRETVPTERLRHVAHLGVAARGFSFANRGLPVPEAAVRVELVAPDGSTWAYGPGDAPERLTGSGLDFCLLVTKRRHRADTDLVATAPGADAWLDIAQCFAGPPTDGPEPTR